MPKPLTCKYCKGIMLRKWLTFGTDAGWKTVHANRNRAAGCKRIRARLESLASVDGK